jgi:hypothetical protein
MNRKPDGEPFIAGGDEFPGDGEDGVLGGLGVAAELVEVDGKP